MKTEFWICILFGTALGSQIPLLRKPGSHASGRFLHLTDIHIDPYVSFVRLKMIRLYKEGTTFDNGCHHPPTVLDTPVAGQFGSPQSGCDAPVLLVNETFRFIESKLYPAGLDFVIWTGDNARHDSDHQFPRTQEEIRQLNIMITNRVLEAFGRDGETIPILPSIGGSLNS